MPSDILLIFSRIEHQASITRGGQLAALLYGPSQGWVKQAQ
ncbi:MULTISPECIES: hypothetical protein [unclassified Brenneria]|nr:MULTISPECIES: hypothetical protein [unclassified Brenneria]MDX5630375.1 hypothetical protein [Brenneria sp. L3-3Z]MDX5697520.1 hypothetical protein [Brenneria sp. L4-2C]